MARKIQVWFRPDQVDLVITMLRTCRREMAVPHQFVPQSDAKEAAREFTQRRIDDVIALFPKEETNAS